MVVPQVYFQAVSVKQLVVKDWATDCISRNSKCYHVQKTEGDGLYLSPSYSITNRGDGLFLKQGKNVTDGSGLILGKNSPFRNIPVLGWLL